MKKLLRQEQGYALLIVLFVIVIFVTLGAVFMAGSLNNARQEQTVDTSNQAVAAAEMGVQHYKTDFELELDQIKKAVLADAQVKLNALTECIQPPTGVACDTEAERTDAIDSIDEGARTMFLTLLKSKIQMIEDSIGQVSGVDNPLIDQADVKYTLSGYNATPFETNDTVLTEVVVDLFFKGEANTAARDLTTEITVQTPLTFLNLSNPVVIDMEVEVIDDTVNYEDVFGGTAPAISCSDLITKIAAGQAAKPYECSATDDEQLEEVLTKLADAGIDPADVKVYISDFTKFVDCKNSCNQLNFNSLNVVVTATDAGASNNLNNLVNASLIINGKLANGNNMNNLGKDGGQQLIIVKELYIDNNVQNIKNSNVLVLGLETGTDARLVVTSNLEIDMNSRMCIDADRIKDSDLKDLAMNIDFSNGGQLVYYTADPNYYFKLLDKNGFDRGNTDAHVVRKDSYTAFLETCGVTFTKKTVESTEIPIPETADDLFDFDVTY